jgi:hypothetical protein
MRLIPAKTTTCNRCGDPQVAWVQSKKGKWYLAAAYSQGGEEVAAPLVFHKCKGKV